MENASKALLIAGGVLIAILLLTLFSYLFRQMASSTSNIYENLEKHEITEFNQQFLNYEGRGVEIGKSPLKVQDVASLINLAQDSKNSFKYGVKVEIRLNGVDIASTQNSKDWLKNNINTDVQYKCVSVHTNSDTLLVDYVEISQI